MDSPASIRKEADSPNGNLGREILPSLASFRVRLRKVRVLVRIHVALAAPAALNYWFPVILGHARTRVRPVPNPHVPPSNASQTSLEQRESILSCRWGNRSLGRMTACEQDISCY